MKKFEEMRLRAIKFQEMTQCSIQIYGDTYGLILHFNSKTGIRYPDFSFHQIREDLYTFRKVGSTSLAIDDKGIPESEWLAGIEKVFGRPFPTLLEAQGWIAVEDGLPKENEPTQVVVDWWGDISTGAAGGFKGGVFLSVGCRSGWIPKIHITSPTRVTHWKPIDIFPEPFQNPNV